MRVQAHYIVYKGFFIHQRMEQQKFTEDKLVGEV